MKKVGFVLITLAFITCISAAIADDIDVTGKWKISMETPRGSMDRFFEFTQEGEKLTVVFEDREGNKHTAEGTVKGDKIEWTTEMQTPRGTFTVAYTGAVEGDTMKGTADFGGRRTSEWTGARVEEEAPQAEPK